MTARDHLDLDQLTAYLAEPEASGAARCGLHLATCSACRSTLSALVTLKRQGHTLGHEAAAADPEVAGAEAGDNLAALLADQSIEAYVDGELGAGQSARVRASLRGDPRALKAALHYARHSAAMAKALPSTPDTAAEGQGGADAEALQSGRERGALLAAWRHWLRQQVSLPRWILVPAATLAAGSLALLMVFLPPPGGGPLQVAHYRDNSAIQFVPGHKGPGIGFFHTRPARVEPFEAVTVTLHDGLLLEITWPRVAQANGYRLRLDRIDNGHPVTVTDLFTTDNRATLAGLEIVPGQRYVWTLSGKTTAAAQFQAEGGFVFHRRDN